MPNIPQDTQDALIANNQNSILDQCDSRSLLLERYGDPGIDHARRSTYLRHAIAKSYLPHKLNAWRRFLFDGLALKPDELVAARLQSRLILNAEAGIIEKAGICIDRFSGIPYIPGSAIKGSARRYAMIGLEDAISADEKIKVLIAISLIFGWGEKEWIGDMSERHRTSCQGPLLNDLQSDIATACGKHWDHVRSQTQKQLLEILLRKSSQRQQVNVIWNQHLSFYSGGIRFLPAYPLPEKDTSQYEFELDVISCHHERYYQGETDFEQAPDTETPLTTVFPALKSQRIFIFPVLGKDPLMRQLAKEWLIGGLSFLGIGGRTSAGYGRFEHLPNSAELEAWYQDFLHKTIQPDPKLIKSFNELNDEQMRYKIKEFEFEIRFWNAAYDDTYKFTLLHFCTVVKPEIYEQEKTNPKSKIVRAIENLLSYFARSDM